MGCSELARDLNLKQPFTSNQNKSFSRNCFSNNVSISATSEIGKAIESDKIICLEGSDQNKQRAGQCLERIIGRSNGNESDNLVLGTGSCNSHMQLSSKEKAGDCLEFDEAAVATAGVFSAGTSVQIRYSDGEWEDGGYIADFDSENQLYNIQLTDGSKLTVCLPDDNFRVLSNFVQSAGPSSDPACGEGDETVQFSGRQNSRKMSLLQPSRTSSRAVLKKISSTPPRATSTVLPCVEKVVVPGTTSTAKEALQKKIVGAEHNKELSQIELEDLSLASDQDLASVTLFGSSELQVKGFINSAKVTAVTAQKGMRKRKNTGQSEKPIPAILSPSPRKCGKAAGKEDEMQEEMKVIDQKEQIDAGPAGKKKTMLSNVAVFRTAAAVSKAGNRKIAERPNLNSVGMDPAMISKPEDQNLNKSGEESLALDLTKRTCSGAINYLNQDSIQLQSRTLSNSTLLDSSRSNGSKVPVSNHHNQLPESANQKLPSCTSKTTEEAKELAASLAVDTIKSGQDAAGCSKHDLLLLNLTVPSLYDPPSPPQQAGKWWDHLLPAVKDGQPLQERREGKSRKRIKNPAAW